MTETENRDPDSGQFTAPTEQLFGREERLVDAGYTPKKDPAPATPDYSSDPDGLRQAAAALAYERAETDNTPLTPADLLELTERPEREALSIKQATEERTAAAADISRFVDGVDLATFAEEIDAKRDAVVQGDPEKAKALGLDEVPKDPKLSRAEKAEAAEIDGMDGLDAETKRALKIPQVRQAIEQEITKAEQATQAYSQGLEHANTFSHAAILAIAPELQGIPLDRWQEAIPMFAQVDPARGQQLGTMLQYVGQIQAAQQQAAAQQKQNLSKWVMAEDAKLEAMVGKQTNAERAQFADDLVAYASELGVSRADLVGAIEAQPVLRSAAMQKMMWDA